MRELRLLSRLNAGERQVAKGLLRPERAKDGTAVLKAFKKHSLWQEELRFR